MSSPAEKKKLHMIKASARRHLFFPYKNVFQEFQSELLPGVPRHLDGAKRLERCLAHGRRLRADRGTSANNASAPSKLSFISSLKLSRSLRTSRGNSADAAGPT